MAFRSDPTGGVLDTVDFRNSARAFTPTMQQVIVGGALVSEEVTSTMNFAPSKGGFSPLGSLSGSSPFTHRVVPDAVTMAGDLHQIGVVAASGLGVSRGYRSAVAYRQSMSNPLTLTLGPPLASPTLSTLSGAPYARIQLRLPRQAEYNNSWNATFVQQAHSVLVSVDETHMGNSISFDVTVPDFAGVSGWQNNWGPVVGADGVWSFTATGWLTGAGQLVDGATSRGAIRTGSFTP